MKEVRCLNCKRKLCEVRGSAEVKIKCPRCKEVSTYFQKDVDLLKI